MTDAAGKRDETGGTGGSLADYVYRRVLDSLFSGALKPGDTLSEFRLAQQLGVSRTPVHIAIRDLARDGLVEQELNRRPRVARVSREDIHEIFEMRRLLECEAARRAAALIDRATLRRLAVEAKKLEHVGETEAVRAWADFDDIFHEAIAEACGSRRLRDDILRYRTLHHALNSIRMTPDLLPQALAEHCTILAALEARDAEAAAAAMASHIDEWRLYYMALFRAEP